MQMVKCEKNSTLKMYDQDTRSCTQLKDTQVTERKHLQYL